ncbi:alpha/beta fold hydrolase [Streptomyces sp. NPDC001070]
MVTETDLELADGRTLHVYDTGTGGAGGPGDLVVLWQHGTPNIGTPPEPLFAAAAARGIRWVSYDRPGYGGSARRPGRDVASAAADSAALADALGIGRFAVMGHSGGGPHALACAALLPDRVLAVAAASGLAPFGAEGLDWFAGMGPSGVIELGAAARGRPALEEHLAVAEFDPELFTAKDHAALAGEWGWLGAVAGKALEGDPGGMVDDDLAYVAPWGFDPARAAAPVLVLHGGADRMVPAAHGEWLSRNCPAAELWLRPGEGHISVLGSATAALDWLAERARQG